MRNKAIENNLHALEFVSQCYKTQNMYDKAVDTYLSAIKFVPECYKTQKMSHRAVHKRFFLYLVISLINIKFKKYVTYMKLLMIS